MKRLALVFVLLGIWLAIPSSATTYYDYWSYWHKPPGATTWQYSKVGPSGYYDFTADQPQVEGWRYAIGTASSSDPKPRPVDVTYDDYCAGKNTSATYRVLLVVDYGTQSGAPSGPVYSCYGSNTQPSGREVLDASHPDVRDNGGLICGIDGYPKSGCGDVVSSPAPKATTHSSSTPVPSPSPTHSAYSGRGATLPIVTPNSSSGGVKSGHPPARSTPTATPAATVSDAPTDSQTIVAKRFVPPHRRGGVPYGFVAACVFVVAIIGAVILQRRRRAG